jgi:hypothetical protein
LYNDGHTAFEAQANIGVDSDNIWQKWPSPWTTKPTGDTGKRDIEVGGYFPKRPTSVNAYDTYTDIMRVGDDDALLISEWQNSGSPG